MKYHMHSLDVTVDDLFHSETSFAVGNGCCDNAISILLVPHSRTRNNIPILSMKISNRLIGA